MNKYQLIPMKKNHVPFLFSLISIPEILEALHMPETTIESWADAFDSWGADADEENYMILNGSTPIGWLSLNGLESGITAWIKMLVIHPEFQRQGAGSFALSEAERMMRERVFDRLCIQTTSDNSPAQRCYETYGFICKEHTNRGNYIYEKELPLNIQAYSDCVHKDRCRQSIHDCDWRAAKFLAHLLKENRLTEYVGEGTLYLLWQRDQLAGFIILAEKDGMPDPVRTPWLSFLFIAPEFRGRRLGKRLIDYACGQAKELGHRQVFLYSDHIGLYEKYGFSYLESRKDVWGDMSSIYMRTL